MYTPSLPYRRLVKFANGIWDENRKTFYPFKTSAETMPAKKGISYFVFSISLQGTNTGDKPVQPVHVGAIINRVTSTLAHISIPASVAAANVNSQSSNFFNLCVLCDPGTEVTCYSTATSSRVLIVFAEIPIDGSGVPVVVQ